jgi:ABC-type ATPase with predicted acetyltransferase domain
MWNIHLSIDRSVDGNVEINVRENLWGKSWMKNGQSRETGNIARTRQSKPIQYVLDTTMHKQAQKKHK